MGPYVHRTLTEELALAAGFSPADARTVADANDRLDKMMYTKPFCHFPLCGALLMSRLFRRLARCRKSLDLLGYAIHCRQDYFSHGWMPFFLHRSSMDEWENLGEERQERLRGDTTAILMSYRRDSDRWKEDND